MLQTFFTYHLWPHCQLEDVSKDAEPRKQDESNVCIKPLDSQWISLLTKSWKYHDEGTMKMLKTLVDLGRVFGLFVKDEKEPVAWMLIYGLVFRFNPFLTLFETVYERIFILVRIEY